MKRTLQWIGRMIVAGTFIYAAVPKISDPAGFAKSIYNYQLIPDGSINALAIYLPWLELAVGIALLLLPAARRGALAWMVAMLLVFIGAIGSAVARGINIDCGCFSTSGQGMKAGVPHLALDVALLIIAALLFRAERASRRSQPES